MAASTARWLVFLVLCAASIPAVGADVVGSLADWQRHRDGVRADRSVLRYYSFEQPLAGSTPVPSTAGDLAPLRYSVVRAPGAVAEAFQAVAGRWPGKLAVRLDQNVLAASAFKLPGRQFAIAAWLRIQGQGVHRGNNQATNGTLLSLGSGYWDGFRLTYQYPQRTIGLEIGRPKPSHSVSIRTRAVPDGVWHHLAATWDGRQMRVYVDGLLAASGEFTDSWTTPAQGQFRVGFANSGVGAVRMDVDEVVIYGRTLAAEEVLCQACLAAPLTKNVAAMVRKGTECLAANDAAAAERELAAALCSPEVRGVLAATLRLARAECLLDLQRSSDAGRELLALVDDAAAASQLHRTALDRLRKLVRESPGNALPGGVHARLLALPDLTSGERDAIRLSLGHRLLAERMDAAARAEYAKIVAQPDASPAMRSVARLRIAQSYVRQHDYVAASAEYQRVAAAADVLPHHRWEAEQQVAQLARLAKGLPARDPAASRVHLPPRPQPGLVFYVSPNGSDTNPGTAAKPFVSLERVRDEIRRRRQAGGLPAGGVEVRLCGGQYSVRGTFELSAQDSGSASAPIVFRAEPGQKPVFSGGVKLGGFQGVDEPAVRARLPEVSRDKVRQVDLRQWGIRDLKPLVLGGYASGHGFRTFPVMELYCNGTPLTMARWPNEGWAKVADIVVPDGHKIHSLVGSKTGRVRYEGDRPRRWLAETDAFLHGYWFWSWADSYERIAAIDPVKRELTLAQPWHRYGYRKGQHFYAVNLLAELDAPGEWYLDRRAAKVYLYPPADLARATVELSVLDRPMVRFEKVEHVTLEGLTWDLGAADAVMLRGCRNCLLTGCTVSRFAGDGVIVDGGTACGLLACNIESLGRGGISMSGGDRKTLTPAGHFVENCHIHHLSRIHPTYTPAVRVTGVGSRIAHNLFHDIASSAINLAGNEHLVELNEAYNIVMESDDQGGVDMFGNPTYRGNVFRYNYWHHVGDWQGADPNPPGGRAGIRLDDAISGVLVYGNVFYRSSTGTWPFGGLQIHGGKDNVADNNLFVDCHVAISFSPWSEQRWREYTQTTLDARDMDRQLYLRRYPALARLPETPNANLVLRNVVCGCGQFMARERGFNELVDNCVTGEKPGYPDAARGRFPFPVDAAILDACGFQPIPVDEIGLYGAQRGKE